MVNSAKPWDIDCSKDKPLTQQSAKDECDINLIVESAKRGADLSQRLRQPIFGNFIGIPDFKSMMQTVIDAKAAFMSLDASIREKFHNSPVELIDFLNVDSNREEAVRLGLLKAPEVPKLDEHLEALKSIDKGLKDARGKASKGREALDD